MSTVAIIGDVGGHADQLERCLAHLGVTSTHWPDGLTVVQVGDLLGGVDDLACVDMVEPHLESGRWVQLLGNWDSREIGWCFEPGRKEPPDPVAEDRFVRWYVFGEAFHAAAVTTQAGATAVVTHGGVTAPFWRQHLGGTSDALEAVARINALPVEVVHRPGQMLGFDPDPVNVNDGYPDDTELEEIAQRRAAVGPIWADTTELWCGWLTVASPWAQVHGHTSAWFRDDWSPYAPLEAVPYARRDRQLCHTRYVSGQGSGPPLIGVDCSVYAARHLVLKPLVIPNAQVSTAVAARC